MEAKKRKTCSAQIGREAGSPGAPKEPDHNSYAWADHAFFVMDNVDESAHTREHLVSVMKFAFAMSNSDNFEDIRGVAVLELVDGSKHRLRGAVFCRRYQSVGSIDSRARKVDKELRGWKAEPEREEKIVNKGGKGRKVKLEMRPVAGTGEEWELAVQFKRAACDPVTVRGNKGKASRGSLWRFKDMVALLLEPDGHAVGDINPFFINCSRGSIFHKQDVDSCGAAMAPESSSANGAASSSGVGEQQVLLSESQAEAAGPSSLLGQTDA